MRSLFKSKLRITQNFGENPDYYKQWGLTGHEGIDLVPTGTVWDVLALEDGVVVTDIDDENLGKNYGKYVTIWHPTINKATQYCHFNTNSVSKGDRVTRGQVIGVMGSTGNTTGAHVHLNLFNVDDNGIRLNRDNGYFGGIDPLPFLNEEIPASGDETVTVSVKQRDDWEQKKEWWNNVRIKLDVEDSWVVVEAKLDELLEYKEKVIVKEGKLEEAQSEINILQDKVKGLQFENAALGDRLTVMAQEVEELQGQYQQSNKSYERALEEIQDLKKDLETPDDGWTLVRKGIRKLLGID